MINSIDELAKLLKGTKLEQYEKVSLPVLDTDEVALFIEIPVEGLEDSWRVARGLLEQTGRWPIVSTSWENSTFPQSLIDEDVFSRFYFEEQASDKILPRTIIEASQHIDIEGFLVELDKESRPGEKQHYRPINNERYKYISGDIIERCGSAPTLHEMLDATIDGRQIETDREFDNWMYRWENNHKPKIIPKYDRFEWFEPDNAFLVFLPTASSWETLAYLNWYGAFNGSEKYIALGKSWEKRFGAEIVCHYGTMLQCVVSRPPTEAQDAWELVQEHYLFAQCDFHKGDIRLNHHARGLLGADRWFLHERP